MGMSRDKERYRRQLLIDGWGDEAQGKVAQSSVTVVGAGGLGSAALLYLAAAGVGRIRIIDSDELALSNLNRQVLYGDRYIDGKKAEHAAARLSELNPDIEVEALPTRLTAENIEQHLPAEGLLVDCLDNFETRFLLNRHAVKHGLPLVHAGVEGMYGQLTCVFPGETPCLECLFSSSKGSLHAALPREIPVLGAAVGTMGCLQALEALKIITGLGTTLRNRLLVFDGLHARFDEVEIKRDPRCAVCAP